MKLREPKFLYFDLGNVLLFFDHHRAARQMAAVAGISEQLAWRAVFESPLEDDYESGKVTSRGFYDHFCKATGSRPDYDALLHAASDIFELNSAIVPIVIHLHRARYRLGILSNTNQSHWRLICDGRYTLVREFFPVVALSFEIGIMKPDPGIYSAAASLARTSPEEIFYTDDRQQNVAGARAAGFDTVLYQSAGQLADELRRRQLRWNY